MYVTVHLSDGRKITKDREKLRFFTGHSSEEQRHVPECVDGYINVNVDHVVDMRPAEQDEIKHAEIHGW